MNRNALLSLLLALVLVGCSSTQLTAPPTPPSPPEVAEVPAPPAAEPAEASSPALIDPDTVSFGRYDTGRMWTFDNPPRQYLRETYAFEPDDAWFEHARLGALRFATYCSASFVSPHGLILTNHHCARESVTKATREGEDLHAEGFFAATAEEERPVEGLFVEQLVEIVNVTDEVQAAVAGAETEVERIQARAEAIEAIEERLAQERGGEEAGLRAQVIEFYSGSQYAAYLFRRYDDVRLAFAPEDEVGFFGGDPDNFTFPRYSLDFALFRAYGEDGQPLETEGVYFPWSENGADEGELVFVIGNPGTTTRLQTVAQLEYRRDVQEPAILRLYSTRADAYERFVKEHPEDPATPEAEDTYFSLSNARKKYIGHVSGLRDPYIIARRAAAERAFRETLAEDEARAAEFGDVFERIAENRREARQLAAATGSFLGMNPGSPVASNVLTRALFAYAAGLTGNERLREAALDVEDRPAALERLLLEARLEDFVHYYGEEHALVKHLLQGRSPEQAARALLEASAFATAEGTAQMVEAGNLAADADPALVLAEALWPEFAQLQQQAGALNMQLQEQAGRLARARFQVYGTEIPPDATFSLRINDGVVRGFPYNGTIAPAHTTFWGLYDRHYSFRSDPEHAEFYTLPKRWLEIPEGFDLSTPYNFVSTNDIIGGNSGSPMLNRDLEVVGVAFDGNIQSLPGDYIYLGDLNRTVAVDSRGMIESLEAVYRAARLVEELRTGAFVAQ